LLIADWKDSMRRSLTAVSLAVSLTWIPACGGPPPSPEKVATMYPEIVPSDPASLRRWEASQYNVGRSKLEVASLACFRDKMTEKGHGEARPVAVEMCRALDSGVAGEQVEALRQLTAAEPELYAKVRAAIYDEYRKSYNTYKQAWSMGASLFGGGAADMEAVLPKLVKGNELDGLVSFGTIYVTRPKDGVSRVGIDLHCPWDEENGLGVVIANGKVERVGQAGVVHLP
jgi:hypothetical protein